MVQAQMDDKLSTAIQNAACAALAGDALQACYGMEESFSCADLNRRQVLEMAASA